MSSIELSFVIIEYNCLQDAYNCVDSISNACGNISYEIIVSSNSTYSPEKQARIRRKMPCAKWLFNGNNKGFAGGMDVGIMKASGKVIVLVNPDLTIASGDMRKAFDYLMSHQNVGLMGPRIVDKQGNVQDSCRKFMTLTESLLRVYTRVFQGKYVLLTREFDYTSLQAVDWVIGAFMMVKRVALKQVGLLDEQYFMYIEDMDWCRRFWNCGFQVVYYPLVEAIYKGDRKSTSALVSKKLFNKYAFYHLNSYLRFLWKNKFKVARKF